MVVSKKKIEKNPKLGVTRSHFYPSELGGVEKAREACLQEAANNEVYWDEKSESWYYNIPQL